MDDDFAETRSIDGGYMIDCHPKPQPCLNALERHEPDDHIGERRRQLNKRPPQRVEEGDRGEGSADREHVAIADVD
jgi:hypothetical protein